LDYSATGVGKIQIFAETDVTDTKKKLITAPLEVYDVLFRDMGTLASYSSWNPSSQIDGGTTRTSTETTLQQIDPTVFGARTVNTNGATVIEFDAKVNVFTSWISLRQGSSSVTNLSPQY